MRGIVSVVVLGLLVAGCGYHLVHYTTDPLHQKRVALQPLRNDSFEPEVALLVNEALRREFLRRGAVRLVDEPRSADLVISGAVLPVEAASRSFSSVNFALEYEITLRLQLEVHPVQGEPYAFKPDAVTASELYLASADVEAARKNREEALRRVADVIAARVHDALVETAP